MNSTNPFVGLFMGADTRPRVFPATSSPGLSSRVQAAAFIANGAKDQKSSGTGVLVCEEKDKPAERESLASTSASSSGTGTGHVPDAENPMCQTCRKSPATYWYLDATFCQKCVDITRRRVESLQCRSHEAAKAPTKASVAAVAPKREPTDSVCERLALELQKRKNLLAKRRQITVEILRYNGFVRNNPPDHPLHKFAKHQMTIEEAKVRQIDAKLLHSTPVFF
jgi:hypothetical protein